MKFNYACVNAHNIVVTCLVQSLWKSQKHGLKILLIIVDGTSSKAFFPKGGKKIRGLRGPNVVYVKHNCMYTKLRTLLCLDTVHCLFSSFWEQRYFKPFIPKNLNTFSIIMFFIHNLEDSYRDCNIRKFIKVFNAKNMIL